MHRRTGDRHHQRDTRLPPVLLAWDLGGGGRVGTGLIDVQSKALPYLILGVAWGWGIFPVRSVTIADPVLPATACRSGACARAVNNTCAAAAADMTARRSLRQAARGTITILRSSASVRSASLSYNSLMSLARSPISCGSESRP